MKKTLLSLSGLAALSVAIAIPVAANQSDGLRGMFKSNHSQAMHSHYNQAYGQNYVAPETWQAKQLRGQNNIYVQQGQPVGMAPVQYASVQTTPYTTAPLGLRGFQSYGKQPVTYSRSAAHEFNNSRKFNVGGVTVRTSSAHSQRMLDWQENVTGRTVSLLANRANGVLQDNSLYIGAGFQGGLKYQKTDRAGQFPILSRFPFFSNRTDTESGVFAIDHAALSFTSTFGDWTTVYLQPEYSETEYPGEQDEFQLRKAFVVFGNLEKTPFYAAFGRKTIDFGNFDSYNAFTNNEGHHYFWAVSDQPVLELGFYKHGFKVTASAFSGGRQLRVALAGEENNIGNYAFNAEKEFQLNWLGLNRHSFTVGGGYLHDTIYRDNFTAHTFQGRQNGTPPTNFIEYRNSAVSGFAEYNSPFFDAMVEYTTTLDPWAAAIPQTPDGVPFAQYLVNPAGSTTARSNINFDENLSVLVAQARIKPIIAGRQLAIAASGSWGNISDDFGNPAFNSSFEKNQQHAVSLEYAMNDYLDFGAEFVYNKGFIPFVAPQLVSNDTTEATAINVGFKARF